MHHHYEDIRALSPTPPLWFDEFAVPRYCAFAPDEAANIYAREVALLRIECQSCGAPFPVAISYDAADQIYKRPTLEALVRAQTIHFGDPPNTGCCPSGPTMNSEPRKVLEFWRRGDFQDWVRVPELEVEIRDEDAAVTP